MSWKNININKQNIKMETGKAVLIEMPHKSKYDGFEFWHPEKLVREGRHSNAVSIGYTDEFTFKLKRVSAKTFNVLDEIIITAHEFENAFGVMDENIVEPKKDTDSYLIVDEPEKIDKDVKVIEELKND